MSIIKDMNQNKIDINRARSFTFELLLLGIYIIAFVMYMYLDRIVKDLKKHEHKVRMIKIFERGLKEKEEDQNESIGTDDKTDLEMKENMAKYTFKMQDEARKVERFFIDNENFMGLSRVFFPIMMLITLLQAMIFNGLCDVPFLIMLLFCGSIFAFRKNYFVFF